MSYNFPEIEKKILKFWESNRIFEKLKDKNEGNPSAGPGRGKPWSFLDGPITANNPMGVHHAWGRTYKDLLLRYKAMQGFDERYQNGFDCQGLWVEVEVEKELGFKTKKDIEVYGIDKFVEKCKERVLKYSAVQTAQSQRLGQWMDWKNSYFTMSDENNYAIWHFLKKCWQEGYLYKGRDSVPWCPRCGTAISQHEILTEEYKQITHKAVYFKLPVISKKYPNTYFLVWTTTPWTIPANVGLIVNPDFEYGVFKKEKEGLILLKSLADKILPKGFALKETVRGKALKGLKYEGPFDDLPRVQKAKQENPKAFHIVALDKDLVTELEGTGIVHCAPGAGEEDFKIGKREKMPVIDAIDEAAFYLDGLGDFTGKSAKQSPELIFNYLKEKKPEYFFKVEDYAHRYPTCWRCKQELVWRVVDEWYISMDKSKTKNQKPKNKEGETLREKLIKIANKIKWIPEFGLGRELDWLLNMHDWLISKKRYWGLTLPIFECECGNFEVIGSKEELKERAVEGWDKFEGHSPHRPWVDNVKIKCKKCGKIISRIKDVGNPWLDAGIVPFSTMKYFEDKAYFKKWFPAEIVCESFPGQFKNWFYSLLVMSAVLEDKPPMKTIFGYASVKDEKGEEMHKSKGNAIWFDEAVEKVGADPMRWMYSKQNPAENLNFGYKALDEIKRKLLVLYNVYAFFGTYVKKEEANILGKEPLNILDRWILSKIDHLSGSVEFNFDKYEMGKAVSAIENFFINDLSLWYVRRSRKRFHENNIDQNDRQNAIATLYYVLLNTAKIISPVMPFFSEEMYQSLRLNSEGEPNSIHLCSWPAAGNKTDLELEDKMDETRNIVSLALAKRAELGIKVRQPLVSLKIKSQRLKIKNDQEFLNLLKDEVNVKEILFDDKIKEEVELDTNITKELKEEGIVRDLIREVQEFRKEMGLKPENRILIWFSSPPQMNEIIAKNKIFISREIKSEGIFFEKSDSENKKEIFIEGAKILMAISKNER